ncbi:hypothetical protein A11M_0113715 [Xanthomonas vasicola pv. vasculorum NCPPB 895]|uniref:Uncharacterized protein n=1 Tax=Xanthomonas vasicola pv. vasculorum NCPPB 890 TaxID=1184265 RepID=A0A836P4J6_XANVA|nr:DUF4238 domain-containing protein [Xanthomonas vasicola]KEZ96760.1 hypothetical protein A11M_0113715 [Xanthomonas vasicola pv. vasculorum NCPPB 895]MBV6744688.1 DUF4238 domain-containing protein [Xanthomonas vasicola pv. vasculorum NCPPB 890]MBV6890301.1 DUF4238 domain-containing protein [Xanthomonas vasicola pv. vasculorum]MBV7303156.1 DUF4238 domain-containing protein [Xanthomonas vasicola pv. vasculorum]MDO6932676.1 DUF4238 domain-containing protein [Xanthomonas vasicola]
MGHHYLPQHYLLGFADGVKVWGHDVRARRSFRTQVKSLANETGMYTEELEKHLANVVEGPAQDVIDRARKRLKLRDEDREVLAAYIIAMWQRVPAGRKRVAGHIPSLAETIKMQVVQQLDAIAASEPDLSEAATRRKEEVGRIISAYKEDPPDYFWHHTLKSGATPRTVQGLLSMNWHFLVSPGESFITCDNPTFFFESVGIAAHESELSFPLSSEVCFWANRANSGRPQYFTTDRSIVLELNRRSAHNTQRFIYTREEAPWVLSFAAKNHPLHRLL